jgi:hypothetical protein
MCTDFTDLNKCCPKDDFPLMRIDQIVDSAVGCEIMALLDCFSWYHPILLRKEDEDKTSFITLSEHTATSQCPKAYTMLAQPSVE